MPSSALSVIRAEPIRSLAALAFAWALILTINEVGFQSAAKSQAQVADLALEGLLQREGLLSNSYLLGQAVSDLEQVGLMRCTTFRSKTRPDRTDFLNTRQNTQCDQSDATWLEPTYAVHRDLVAGNHEILDAKYQVILGPGYALGLWGSRILWSILIFLFWYAVRARFRHQQVIVALKNAHAEELVSIATQVSHDITSPVAALSGLINGAENEKIPLELRMKVRSEILRIQDTAQDLLSRFRERGKLLEKSHLTKAESSLKLLAPLVEGIVSEKKMAHQNRPEIQILFTCATEDLGHFSILNASKFQRTLSNLLNNAIESLPQTGGRIAVSLTRKDDVISIMIEDTGKGIPPEILAQLGNRGMTFGKPEGNGLGLYDAKNSFASWGGELEITSQQGQGTQIQALLRRALPPVWFVESLNFKPGQKIVILDDEEQVHDQWKTRLASLNAFEEKVEAFYFLSGSAFKEWFKQSASTRSPVSYFFDHALAHEPESGLDIAESLGIAATTTVVTYQHNDPSIQSRCNQLNSHLLPKAMLEAVPMAITQPYSSLPDAIFIDDEPSNHTRWKRAAKKHDKQLRIFACPQQFFECEWIFNRATPIYVDVDLGNGISGETVSQQIAKRGFSDIHLATAYPKNSLDLQNLNWVRSISGKSPPWEGERS